MAKKPKYTVVRSNIEHDGKTYEPGEAIPVTPAQAAPLLAVTAIVESEGEEDGKK